MATKDYIVNVNEFTTEGYKIDAKGKSYLRIDGIELNSLMSKFSLKIDENNLIITNTVNSNKLIVENYTGIKYIKTDYEKVGKRESYNLYDIINSNVVDNTSNPITTYNNKTLSATGTKYNDKIDFSTTSYTPIGKTNIAKNRGLKLDGGIGNDEIIGTNFNDTILGGNGDDRITGGKGADVITGGNGKNIINYTKDDGNDVINLTKGENFTLKLSGIDFVAFAVMMLFG